MLPAPKTLLRRGVAAGSAPARRLSCAVLASAHAEWEAVTPFYPNACRHTSPYGEYFFTTVQQKRLLFFQTGWGKVAAAAATQYVLDRFRPERLLHLGTCGGVAGRIQRFEVVCPDKVVIYDIGEAMGDAAAAMAHYTTALARPPHLPRSIRTVTLYSADRDLTAPGLQEMESRFQPTVVDWESGAIAWVAQQNRVPLLILRGVSDLVSPVQAEAQGNAALFAANATRVMQQLVRDLPHWLAAFC